MMAPPFTATPDGVAQPRRTWAIASVLAAMVLVVLDAAIVNVALPSIGRALRVEPARSVGVVTAYQLGLIVTLFPAAALGERLGFRKIFVAGAALFVAASAFCSLAPSLNWLVAARFFQGVGGAAIMSLGVALLRFSVPQNRLGAAIGWNALTVALSSAVGPTLGAVILSVSSWRWLFGVNLPIGVCVLFAARALPDVQGTQRPIDMVSVALNGLTLALLVISAVFTAHEPAHALVLFVVAAVLGATLVRREMHRASPLIPIDLLREASFRVSIVSSVLCFIGQAASLVALPFYLQHRFGLTPLMVGVYMSPWPLAVAMTGPLAGRLADHAPTAILCLMGGVFLAAGLAAAASLPARGSEFAIVFSMLLCGLGFGLFNVPNNRNMFLSASRARSGAVGGMQSVARLTGQTAGAVLMTLLLSHYSLSAAPRIGLAVAAVLSFAAGVTSLWRISARR